MGPATRCTLRRTSTSIAKIFFFKFSPILFLVQAPFRLKLPMSQKISICIISQYGGICRELKEKISKIHIYANSLEPQAQMDCYGLCELKLFVCELFSRFIFIGSEAEWFGASFLPAMIARLMVQLPPESRCCVVG